MWSPVIYSSKLSAACVLGAFPVLGATIGSPLSPLPDDIETSNKLRLAMFGLYLRSQQKLEIVNEICNHPGGVAMALKLREDTTLLQACWINSVVVTAVALRCIGIADAGEHRVVTVSRFMNRLVYFLSHNVLALPEVISPVMITQAILKKESSEESSPSIGSALESFLCEVTPLATHCSSTWLKKNGDCALLSSSAEFILGSLESSHLQQSTHVCTPSFLSFLGALLGDISVELLEKRLVMENASFLNACAAISMIERVFSS